MDMALETNRKDSSTSVALFKSLSERQDSVRSHPPELENATGWKANICRYIHKRPGKFCATYCCALFIMTIIGLGLFPFLEGTSDISNPRDPANVASDAIMLARQDFNVDFETDDDENNDTNIYLVYLWDDGREEEIINAKNLQDMCNFEATFFERYNPDFEECDTTNTTGVCVTASDDSGVFEAKSIVQIFYQRIISDFSFADCVLLEQEDVSAAVDTFYTEMENEFALFRNGFFVNSRETTTELRSLIGVGSSDPDDTKDAMLDLEADIFEYCGSSNTFFRTVYSQKCVIGDTKVIIFMLEVLDAEVTRLILADTMWVMISFLFVSVWMFIYTKSKFLTMCFMAYIFATASTSIFIYKAVLQIAYFDFLQILAIFLIIGVGADANFVVLDAWRQSGEIFVSEKQGVDENTIELRRLIYAYSRSTETVFNTSLTTFCAFLFTAITPIVSISAFGIFAAMCILVNYIFCLSIVPATILYYHRKWGKKPEDTEQEGEREAPTSWDKAVENVYVPFMLKEHKIVVLVLLVAGIIGLIGTIQISELTEQENFLPSSHMLQQFVKLDNFLSSNDDEFSRLTFAFGLKGVNRDIFSRYSGDVDKYKQNVVYDDDFVLDVETINDIVAVCDAFEQEPCEDSRVCKDFVFLVTPEDESYNHLCPLKDFNSFHENTFNVSLLGEDPAHIPLETIAERLEQFLDLISDEDLLESFGVDEGRVKFTTIEFRTVISPFNPGAQNRRIKRQLQDFVDEQETTLGLSNILFASIIFVTEATGRALLDNAVRGLAITIPVVYLILMRATNNIVLATLCVFTIAFILLCIMGIIAVPLGWELGTSESIITIMIVGLSVDFAVHLSHMYVFAWENDQIATRDHRFAFSAKMIAQTVVAGALTTMGASAFLLGTQFTFFFKMGLLITLTILLSMIYALFFLMGLFIWIGPEKDDFNIDKIYKTIKERVGTDRS